VAAETIIVAGIEVPSVSPLFLGIVGFHVVAGAMGRDHGRIHDAQQEAAGSSSALWNPLLLVPLGGFCSATLLSIVRWAEDYHLFILGTLSFGTACVGRTARRHRWRGWVGWHITSMGLSYILLLTAFYVDNGHSLPLWRDLPTIAYWLVPGAIGIPLIFYTLLRHPLVRQQN
jgi:hypothetical protein